MKFIFLLATVIMFIYVSAGATVNVGITFREDGRTFTLPNAAQGTSGAYDSYSIEANFKIISNEVVRFTFTKPLNLEVMQDGAKSTIVIPFVDVKTTPEIIEGLKIVSAGNTNLYFKKYSGDIPFSTLVEAHNNKSSLMPILRSGVLRSLESYNGVLGLPSVKLDAFLMGNRLLEGSISASAHDVVRYDVNQNKLIVDKSSSSPLYLDEVAKGEKVITHDLFNGETMAALSAIESLNKLRKILFGRIVSFEENGLEMVGVIPPAPADNNVTRFPTRKSSCQKLFE